MSSPSRIYRIEHHSTGKGPYQSTDRATETPELAIMRDLHANSKQHPTHLEDKMLSGCKDCRTLSQLEWLVEVSPWLFGFKTIIQLRNWFTDFDLQTLHENGYNLVVYDVSVDHSCSLRKQSVFDKRKAVVAFRQNVISLIRNK